MSSDEEALERLVRLLEQAGVPYMLTGSIASSHHGLPRATNDAGVLRVSGSCLDHAYVEKWAAELGIAELWHALLAGEPPEGDR